VNGGPLLKLVT